MSYFDRMKEALKYDDNQPRDDHGRWSASNGSANWVEPGEKSIRQEYDVEYQKHLRPSLGYDPFPTFESFKTALAAAPRVTVDHYQENIGGRSHTQDIASLRSLISSYRSWGKHRNDDTLKALASGVKDGKPMDMPIILKMPGGGRQILSGNTRMDISSWHFPKAKVIELAIPPP